MIRLALIIGFIGIFLMSAQPSGYAAEDTLDGDKVLVLMVFDQHCKKWCSQVRPMLKELKTEYGDKIAVYELDVTENVLKDSMVTAGRLNVASFVKGVLDWVPTVGVFTAKRRLVKEIPGKLDKNEYTKNIDKALKSS